MVTRTLRQLRPSEPVDTQRPIWSSTPFVKDSTSIDRDYFSLPLSSRDGKSDDAQRPIWSSAPFVEDSMSIDRDYFSLSFSSSRDKLVR